MQPQQKRPRALSPRAPISSMASRVPGEASSYACHEPGHHWAAIRVNGRFPSARPAHPWCVTVVTGLGRGYCSRCHLGDHAQPPRETRQSVLEYRAGHALSPSHDTAAWKRRGVQSPPCDETGRRKAGGGTNTSPSTALPRHRGAPPNFSGDSLAPILVPISFPPIDSSPPGSSLTSVLDRVSAVRPLGRRALTAARTGAVEGRALCRQGRQDRLGTRDRDPFANGDIRVRAGDLALREQRCEQARKAH